MQISRLMLCSVRCTRQERQTVEQKCGKMQSADASNANQLTILLAEDDPREADLVRGALERLGIVQELCIVQNGAEALAYLQGEGKYADRRRYPFPNLLLLDYRMPILSGLGVLCWLRSELRFETLPVILLSNTFSAAQAETVARMHAACCAKRAASVSLMEAIAVSIRRVLRERSTPHDTLPLADNIDTDFIAKGRLPRLKSVHAELSVETE